MASRQKQHQEWQEQQLKDRLWAMVRQLDFSDKTVEDIEALNEYEAWDDDMQKYQARYPSPAVKVPGFELPVVDLAKVREELDDSCLSEAAKKAITAALDAAK